jgi:ATP-binding cassette subfamily C (CFTR/MRP) protein 4
LFVKESQEPLLKNLNMEISNKELLAIAGPVGSGKTSLLMTILGEIESIKGNLKVSGSIFYVPQEP